MAEIPNANVNIATIEKKGDRASLRIVVRSFWVIMTGLGNGEERATVGRPGSPCLHYAEEVARVSQRAAISVP